MTGYLYQAMWRRLARETPEGTWTLSDTKGVARIDRSDGEVGIVIAKGDQGEGKSRPRTSARKGPMMEKGIRLNCRQLHFRDVVASECTSDWPRYTWLLLHNLTPDESGRELSIPISIGRNGYVNGFAERIVLDDGSAEDMSVTETADEEIDFKVTKKDVS